MGIITAFAIPSMNRIIQSIQLNGEVQDFIFAFNDARAKAIMERRSAYVLTVNSTAEKASYEIKDTGATLNFDKNKMQWADSTSLTSVTFNYMGMTVGSDGSIINNQCLVMQHYKNVDLKRVIMIQNTGTITVLRNQTSCANS